MEVRRVLSHSGDFSDRRLGSFTEQVDEDAVLPCATVGWIRNYRGQFTWEYASHDE